MGLGDAWAFWWHGQLSPSLTLWGVKIFWWARFGKALQLVAGATILAEIIGAENLRKFGNSLHKGLSISQSLRAFNNSVSWYVVMIKYMFTSDKEAENRYIQEADKYSAGILYGFLCIIFLVGTPFGYSYYDGRWFMYMPLGLLIGIMLAGLIGPIVTVLVIVIFLLFGSVLDFLIIEPLAWVLERQRLERFTKLFAFLLLLIGFHFDFLSS